MKMTDKTWAELNHFNKSEAWGNPYLMEVNFIRKLEQFRERLNMEFIIHCGYAVSGHSENSQHYKGNAGDGHTKGIDLLDLYLAAERTGFGGIGLYVWGIHVDDRVYTARWCGIPRIKKMQALTAVNIDKLRSKYKHKEA